MIESGKSLSYSKNYCSVLEKIASLHDIKQNEKHPLIKQKVLSCRFSKYLSALQKCMRSNQVLTMSVGRYKQEDNYSQYVAVLSSG